jgi:hypothetical protein
MGGMTSFWDGPPKIRNVLRLWGIVAAGLALSCQTTFKDAEDDVLDGEASDAPESEAPPDADAREDADVETDRPVDADAGEEGCEPALTCIDGSCRTEEGCCVPADCGPGGWECVDHGCICESLSCSDDGFCAAPEGGCCAPADCGGGAWSCTEHLCTCPTAPASGICSDGFCPDVGQCCIKDDCGIGSWACAGDLGHVCICDGAACSGECHAGWACCPGQTSGSCEYCGTHTCNTSGQYYCQHGEGAICNAGESCTYPDGPCIDCTSGQHRNCNDDCRGWGDCWP